MKELMFVVLRHEMIKNKIIRELNKHGFKGTVIPSTSLKHAMLDSSIEPMPMFGAFRNLTEKEGDLNTTILLVIDEGQFDEVKSIIYGVAKSSAEKEGIMFTVPILYFEESIN